MVYAVTFWARQNPSADGRPSGAGIATYPLQMFSSIFDYFRNIGFFQNMYFLTCIIILLRIIIEHAPRTLPAVPTGERYSMFCPSSSPGCFLSGGGRGAGPLFWILGFWIARTWGSFWLRGHGRAVLSSSSLSIFLFARGVGVLTGTPDVFL